MRGSYVSCCVSLRTTGRFPRISHVCDKKGDVEAEPGFSDRTVVWGAAEEELKQRIEEWLRGRKRQSS